MAERWALIEDGEVINVILAASDPTDMYPELTVVRTDTAGPGDLYDGRDFTRSDPEPRPPSPDEQLARLVTAITEASDFADLKARVRPTPAEPGAEPRRTK